MMRPYYGIFSLLYLGLPSAHAIDFRRWQKLVGKAQHVNKAVGRDLQDTDDSRCHYMLKLALEISTGIDADDEFDNDTVKDTIAIACACHENDKPSNKDGSTSTLICTTDRGHHCIFDDWHSRINSSFEARMSDAGSITSYREVVSAMSEGGNNNFVIDYFGCDDGVDNCEECRVSVNNEECTSCVLNDCGDGYVLPAFSCENVESGSNFDLCEKSFLISEGGQFAFLHAAREEHKPCATQKRVLQDDVPSQSPSESLSPSASQSPTKSPNPTFFSDNRCPLRISTSNCAEVVQATNLVPIDGCDCYNFCNGEYVGCSGLRETGSVDCDPDFVPVAGCRLDGVVDEGPDLGGCTADLGNGTTQFFEEGESFGELITVPQCGSTDDFPCFCRSLSEDDQIRCPYCLFDKMGGGVACARDNQNVTFVDPTGVTRLCACNYLGNDQSVSQCQEVVEPPPPTCGLQRNTDQCATVTEFVSPMEGCDCYNFCEGGFSSCCRFGETCTANCLTGSSSDDIVAGCEIDPNKAPVEIPSMQPSEGPTEGPITCPLVQNTGNCARLTQNQDPVEGCDCYNYCGDSFSNCCSADDPSSCGTSCMGLPPGSVLTVGCQLPQCRPVFSNCNSDDDCCTGQCIFSLCRRPTPSQGKRAVKLSGTRGGAAGRFKGRRLQVVTKEKMKRKIRGS